MTMNHWQTQASTQGTHYSLINSTHFSLKEALENCAAKAISLLNNNIQDDSLYLLFEWNPETSALNIVVTDASKQHDSPLSVGVSVEQLEKSEDTTEVVQFLLSDYLASCSAFFRYSLVAIFHSGNRANSNLL
jgi:hypothetical protein